MNDKRASGELPPQYEEWKKAANRTSNWRERLAAVKELSQWKSQQSIDILTRIAANDAVYQVQEAAFRQLKKWGQPVSPPSKKKGDLIKGTGKVLLRIKKSLPEGHTIGEFKEKLKKTRADIYDTYEGDKGAGFDDWLEKTWASLPAGGRH